jgi:hypothetical protein
MNLGTSQKRSSVTVTAETTKGGPTLAGETREAQTPGSPNLAGPPLRRWAGRLPGATWWAPRPPPGRGAADKAAGHVGAKGV